MCQKDVISLKEKRTSKVNEIVKRINPIFIIYNTISISFALSFHVLLKYSSIFFLNINPIIKIPPKYPYRIKMDLSAPPWTTRTSTKHLVTKRHYLVSCINCWSSYYRTYKTSNHRTAYNKS